ncbi:MAG: AAA family ATPase, partial [Ktedonobacterales bacterium]|nr:AAA family ATPase [Ktedonobacterales bacterium]
LTLIPVRRAAPRRPNNTASMFGGGVLAPDTVAQANEAGENDTSTGNGESDGDGELVAISPEEISQLPPNELQRLRANRDQVEQLLERMLPRIHQLEETARASLRALDRVVAEKALATLGDETIARYKMASADAVEFLQHLRADLIAHADRLNDGESGTDGDQGEGEGGQEGPSEGAGAIDDERDVSPALAFFLRRYAVNVISAHKADEHAPVIEEQNPTRGNLLGRIELGLIQGMPYTDHLMIKPGALHRANGGYLIIHARDLFNSQRAWDTLKKTLRFGTITTDINADGTDGPRSTSLRPEPIQANIRVILIGTRAIYVSLVELDPEFRELFKVRADFDDSMPRLLENEKAYANFAGEVARSTGSPPLTSEAVALLIQQGSRWADDQNRLSTLFGDVRDLTSEACYWARKSQAATTARTHMATAIAQRERRVSLLPERALYEPRQNGQVLIDTETEVVGQINGLSVVETVDMAYG